MTPAGMVASARQGGSASDEPVRPITIAILAMGGEGGGVLADWLVDMAEHAGWHAQTTSVPGVAQRTGATIYYLELFPANLPQARGRLPVLAMMPTSGEIDLAIASELMEAGRAVRPGLDATGWSVDQAARILLALASYRGDGAAFAATLDRILSAAEIGEQIALLRGLALFPAGDFLLPRAAEGVRSAMQPIFEAVAHRNPYPRERFSEAQWNQMVVKTLFIGSRLSPIQGLDARRNADLARMLVDYAAERRAAGRSVSPELWRCVAPFAGEAEVAILAAILREGTDAERAGAALALAESALPAAKAALSAAPDLAAAVAEGRLAWDTIA